MPNQPKTPHFTFRIPADVQRRAREKAAREGRTLSDVVRELLEKYVTD